MTDEKDGTSTQASTGTYGRAVMVTTTTEAPTAVAPTYRQTVTASRVEGDIRVRFVPMGPPVRDDDTL